MYRLALTVCLLLPAVCRAESFTVWESGGNIWARENATGIETNLTLHWSFPCSQPDVAAYTAVFVTTNTWPAIYASPLDHRFPADLFPVYISITGAAVAQPKVGVVSTQGKGDYWAVWRMSNGLWAHHIPSLHNWDAFEALPNYRGSFDVEGDQLLYEGGTITLISPPPSIPEPSGLLPSILAALILILWCRHRRPAVGVPS